MSRFGQRLASGVAATRLKPVAVLVARRLPRPTFAAARRLRVADRATDGLINEVTTALRQGRERLGRDLAHALLSHAPLSSDQRGVVDRELGWLHHSQGRYREAVESLTSAVARLPSDKRAAELLVHAAVAVGDATALEEALPKAPLSELDPDVVEAALTVLGEAGEWRPILASVREQELSESTLLHVAALAERLADPDSRAEADDLLDEELDSARIWFERGRRLESDGHPDEALAAYGKALQRPSPSPATLYRAGRLHLRAGDPIVAESCLAEAVRLKPDRARWRYEYGRALLAVERHPEAVDELTRAIQLGPKDERRHAVALARARRRAGVAAPGVDQDMPPSPSIDQLRDVGVGIAAPLTEEAAIGWILDLPGAEHRIEIEVNGIPVARTRAAIPVRLADGRIYLRFRRTIRDLWSFLGKGDVVRVTVGGEPLPIMGGGDRLVIDLDRPSCVVGLEGQLERGYILNKYGRIRRSIRDDDRWQESVIDLFHVLRRDVHEAIGAELFPFYGTLLGAVREGDFLSHDNDFDTAYISSGTTPSEVHDEFLHLCDHLIGKGHRIEARAWHVWVRVPGTRRRLDISFCWFDEDDRLQAGYGYHGEATERSDTFSVDRPVRLGSYELLAPGNAEELLAQLYGPGWRQPDPGFSHYSSTRVQDPRYRVSRELRDEVERRQSHRIHQGSGDPS